MFAFIKRLLDIHKNDPIKKCTLYKEKGCSHVDGLLYDYPNCLMNKEYIRQKYGLKRDTSTIKG